MKQKFLLSVFLFLLLAPFCAAEKVLYVNLVVHENDTVDEDYVIVTEGRPTLSFRESGDYAFQVNNASGASVWKQGLDIYFGYDGPVDLDMKIPSGEMYTRVPISYRIPFNAGMKKIVLLHNDQVIYSKEVIQCDQNTRCEGTETHESCPSDCPIAFSDHVCLKDADGLCDPDCAPDADPDCGAKSAKTLSTTPVSRTTTITRPENPAGERETDQMMALTTVVILLLSIALFILRRKRKN